MWKAWRTIFSTRAPSCISLTRTARRAINSAPYRSHRRSRGPHFQSARSATRHLSADVPALLGLRRFVRATKPDVIHAHSSKAGALVRGLAMFGLKARVFYTPHAYYRMNAPQGSEGAILSWDRTSARGIRHHDYGIVGRGCLCANPHRPPAPAPPHCHQWGGLRPIPAPLEWKKSSRLRARFGVPAGALVLGTVGRFSAQKDPLTIYAALARAATAAPERVLRASRQGRIGTQDRCAPGRLRPRRALPAHSVSRRYRAILSDAGWFVLASLYEGMSFAALEALATNLPIILTQAPGNQDFAKYGLDQVYWTAPGDVAALAEAILSWRRRAIIEGIARTIDHWPKSISPPRSALRVSSPFTGRTSLRVSVELPAAPARHTLLRHSRRVNSGSSNPARSTTGSWLSTIPAIGAAASDSFGGPRHGLAGSPRGVDTRMTNWTERTSRSVSLTALTGAVSMTTRSYSSAASRITSENRGPARSSAGCFGRDPAVKIKSFDSRTGRTALPATPDSEEHPRGRVGGGGIEEKLVKSRQPHVGVNQEGAQPCCARAMA